MKEEKPLQYIKAGRAELSKPLEQAYYWGGRSPPILILITLITLTSREKQNTQTTINSTSGHQSHADIRSDRLPSRSDQPLPFPRKDSKQSVLSISPQRPKKRLNGNLHISCSCFQAEPAQLGAALSISGPPLPPH